MALIKLLREERTEPGYVFCVGPFGTKTLTSGGSCNFDSIYAHVLAPTVAAAGMTAVRGDEIFGTSGVIDTVWRGIQKSEVVIVDFTAKSPNVAAEFVMALLLGKHIIVITQNAEDIPTDVRGLYRYIAYSSDFESVDKLKSELTQQLQAIREESTTEMMLVPMPVPGNTQAVPARVVIVDREFVIVQTDDNRRGVLGNADVDYARIVTDMSRKFSVNERVSGAFVMDIKGESKYTLLAGQTNPWPVFTADYPVGGKIVRSVHKAIDKVGAFVQIDHGINGLIPESTLGAQKLACGDEVEVSILQVDSEHRRVALRLERVMKVTKPKERVTKGKLPPVGYQTYGEVVRATPENGQTGGFILLRLAGYEQLGLLHCTQMSPELRADLNNKEVEIGEEIFVQVVRTDAERRRVALKEIPEPDEPAVPTAA
jgi:small subunit ribosomal protein S1